MFLSLIPSQDFMLIDGRRFLSILIILHKEFKKSEIDQADPWALNDDLVLVAINNPKFFTDI